MDEYGSYLTDLDAQLNDDEQQELDDIAPIIVAHSRQPYVLGRSLAGVLWQIDETDALNSMYENPPPDTRALLDPWGYVEGEHRAIDDVEVRLKLPDGAEPTADSFVDTDAVSWFYTLRGELPFERALTAGRNYEATRAQTYFVDDRACFAMISAKGAAAIFQSAVLDWARSLGIARNSALLLDAYTIVGCDPGVDVDLPLPESFVDDLYAITFVADGESWAIANNLEREVGACEAYSVIDSSGESSVVQDWLHFDGLAPSDLSEGCR